MSVWVAGSLFFGRLYGTLNRVYRSPQNGDEHTLRRHIVQSFPKIDWQNDKIDPVKELCVRLWRLNLKAYNARYGEKLTIGQTAIKLMLTEASEVSDTQLFKDIGFLEYQTDGDATSKSWLYKGLVELENRIAVWMVMRTPEYNDAKWG